jgi:hypothetical protein
MGVDMCFAAAAARGAAGARNFFRADRPQQGFCRAQTGATEALTRPVLACTSPMSQP